MSVTAGNIMDRVASFLNDAAKTQYTYAIMIPYLNAAIDEMQETMQLNTTPAINKISPSITVTAGTATSIVLGSLPADFIAPVGLVERDPTLPLAPFTPMTRQEFLTFDRARQGILNIWAWQAQIIQFIGATTDREVKVNYIGTAITPVVASTDVITLFNCESFLAHRTTALCALFAGENKTRADEADQFATVAMERFIRLNGKGTGPIILPRKPYSGMYKAKDEQ
jgi:hypothetical protein